MKQQPTSVCTTPDLSSCILSKRSKKTTYLSTGKSFLTLTPIFREQLQKNAREGKYFLRVSMEHLLNFDENLAELLRSQPTQVLNSLEQAIGTVYKNHYAEENSGFENSPNFQLQISSNENPRMLRDLQSNLMG